MRTWTGKMIDPLKLRIEDVAIADIAHHLSLICRYNGACAWHYSVAQHCVLLCDYWLDAAGAADDPRRFEIAMWLLLHDAAEAYVCDLPRPVKLECPGFTAAEDRALATILLKFGLVGGIGAIPDIVWDLDRRILVDEMGALFGSEEEISPARRAVRPRTGDLAGGSAEYVESAGAESPGEAMDLPLGIKIIPHDPATVERLFLTRFEWLFIELKNQRQAAVKAAAVEHEKQKMEAVCGE